MLLVLAMGNGVLRQATYGKVLDERTAHQVSTLVAIAVVGLAVWAWSRRRPFVSAAQAWAVGAAWSLATVVFEFGFGHWVIGHPWTRLLADYDLSAGRVWPVFLIWLTVLPSLVRRFGGGAG